LCFFALTAKGAPASPAITSAAIAILVVVMVVLFPLCSCLCLAASRILRSRLAARAAIKCSLLVIAVAFSVTLFE
jgi:hypothetical protein